MTRGPRLLGAAALAIAGALAGPRAGAAPGAAGLVEKEYAAVIRRVTPATVVCVAQGSVPGFDGSSGVLVSRDGYVLSDIDASNPDPRKSPREFTDKVDVRVPDVKRGTHTMHVARVVARDEALDTTLLKVDPVPAGGFAFVAPGTADGLRIGSITFVTGNSFGLSKEGTPTLTAGVVSGLVRALEGAPHGKNLEIYSSAAVNPGVNGGPLVDVEGRLVGVVSMWIEASGNPGSPFQSLSKAFPVDRLRAFYADRPEAAAIFPDSRTVAPQSQRAARMEAAFGDVAADVVGRVVSLTVERAAPLKVEVPSTSREGPKTVPLPRYHGPVSGVLVSRDGWVVTSLYNLADTTGLALSLPNRVREGLTGIVSVTAHLRDGRAVPARVVAHDQRVGIVLLKAETGTAETGTAAPRPAEAEAAATAGAAADAVWTAAPPESFQVGRMALCVGNPFGPAQNAGPLLTVGIVSRVHSTSGDDAWRGNVQTDAAVTDGNCGGALVDLRGRILGVSTIWAPTLHGRAAGIAFGIPWDQVLAALPAMKAGKSVGSAFLGIGFDASNRLENVVPDGPAAKAGLVAGDRIVRVDGVDTPASKDVVQQIRTRSAGDRVRLSVDRGGRVLEVEVVLGERS